VWNAFKEILLQILVWIHTFAGDWGLTIIIFTFLIRLLLWPLTAKQVKSTYEMQKVTPEIKRIQEKYKDDKEKQQEELMKFYSENKVNPFASCLPMILQMPFFWALYQVLGPVSKSALAKTDPSVLAKINLSSYLTQQNEVGQFFGIIHNIALTPAGIFKSGHFVTLIPYVLLVALFGLSIWLPQALMPGEKSQKMIGLYMAVFMLFIGWSSPAGVLLYWDVSSLLGIAQQQFTQAAVKKALGDQEELVEEAIELADGEIPKKKKGPKGNKKK